MIWHDNREFMEALRASGDLVVIETCGGGGFGNPADRSPALTARDRLEGYLA